MKFGIELGFQLPRPWNDESEYELYESRLKIAELADQLGFDSLWVEEHHFLEEYCHLSSPEVFLAACTQRTKQIRLGFGVMLLPPMINNPVRSAEKVASIDLLAKGRVELGVGSSSDRLGTSAWGVDWEQRQEITEEVLGQVARMMVEEPYRGYDGVNFSFDARNIVPKPHQKPHPPLWMACSHRESILKAARLGIGALSFGFTDSNTTKQWVEAYHSTLRREAIPIGYSINPNLSVLSRLICCSSDSQARQIQQKVHFWWYSFVHYFGHGSHKPGVTDLWNNYTKSDYKFEWDTGTIGTPKKIAATLRDYEEAGLDQIVFSVEAGTISHEEICASLELFAKEVMPEFKNREKQKTIAEESFNLRLSREVMARKPAPHAIRDIPTVVMKDLRPWYSYMGFPLNTDGFPILDEMQ
jgi:alkanesulfonate monooxygenase SsuD/methylene tetrahydromethanopterin reductase-like flavin-dependent oxidoreductase (luciferase family)|tara:strand:- start:88 stop:1329 length:1242 start_codon:yes stop_codon:yes gene_type:complete